MAERLDPETVRKGCARPAHGHGARSPLTFARQMPAELGEDEDGSFERYVGDASFEVEPSEQASLVAELVRASVVPP